MRDVLDKLFSSPTVLLELAAVFVKTSFRSGRASRSAEPPVLPGLQPQLSISHALLAAARPNVLVGVLVVTRDHLLLRPHLLNLSDKLGQHTVHGQLLLRHSFPAQQVRGGPAVHVHQVSFLGRTGHLSVSLVGGSI